MSEASQKDKNKYIDTNMESRKMVLMNLLEGRSGDTDGEDELWTHWGREGVGRMEKVALVYTHYHV